MDYYGPFPYDVRVVGPEAKQREAKQCETTITLPPGPFLCGPEEETPAPQKTENALMFTVNTYIDGLLINRASVDDLVTLKFKIEARMKELNSLLPYPKRVATEIKRLETVLALVDNELDKDD